MMGKRRGKVCVLSLCSIKMFFSTILMMFFSTIFYFDSSNVRLKV